MAEIVLVVMLISATLYAVLGGADFGVGLIEPFIDPRERKRIDVAIAPVWEANHVWLVLLATLAFVGFPPVYAAVTGFLHIPLLLVLLGIVARGSAFTFRHYDPRPGGLASWYTLTFRFGSFLTPLFLGITLAATAHGTLEDDLSHGFYAVYVAPWNTAFGWATGAFVCALFAFQGAALLAAEHANDETGLPYARLARNAHLLAIALGGLTLGIAFVRNLSWLTRIWQSPLALAAFVFATALVPLVAYAFRRGRPWLLRVATGAQVASVLLGFFVGQLPTLVRMRGGDLTIANAQAPAATFRTLLWAVAIGLCAIVPGVVYLIRVYKGRDLSDSAH
jgi:cytochrome bd ubiquinol oxidase subunit II